MHKPRSVKGIGVPYFSQAIYQINMNDWLNPLPLCKKKKKKNKHMKWLRFWINSVETDKN